MRMKNEKLTIALGMMILFVMGATVTAAFATERPPIAISIPDTGNGDCGSAGAMAAGQHQYLITNKKQLSISGAYRGECSAASIGTAFTHNQTLYSGQMTYEEGGEVSAGIAASITFN